MKKAALSLYIASFIIIIFSILVHAASTTYPYFPPPGTNWVKSLLQWENPSFLVHTAIGSTPAVNTFTANGATEGETFVALQRNPGDTGVCPTTTVTQGFDACLKIQGTSEPFFIASFNNSFNGGFVAGAGTSGVSFWNASNTGGDEAVMGITTESPASCSKAFGGGAYAFAPAGNECVFLDTTLQNNVGTGTGGVIAAQGITAFSYSPTQDFLVVGNTPKAYVNAANSAGTSVTTILGDTTLSPSITYLQGGAPTVSSGFGTSPTIGAGSLPSSVIVVVGSGGTASSGVLSLPTATHGWACSAADVTTPTGNATQQTATSASSATFTNFSRTTGTATAWSAGDNLAISCFPH